jgi:replicative DNA helicase
MDAGTIDGKLQWQDGRGWTENTAPDLFKNHEAERAVIGALLTAGSADRDVAQVFSVLGGRDFVDPSYRELYRVMRDLHRRKRAIDLITVDEACGRKQEMLDLMIEACQAVPTTANTRRYAEVLRRATARRDFAALADNIKAASGENEFDAAKLTERIRAYIKNLNVTDGEDTSFETAVSELMDEIMRPDAEKRRILMGIPKLDDLLDGLQDGRQYAVGARPGVGKTVFGLTAAARCARAGRTAIYVNCEMEKRDLARRIAAEASGLTMDELSSKGMEGDRWSDVLDALGKISQLPIRIINRARTPAQFRAKVDEIAEREDVGLIVIDYLQRLHGDGKFASRREEVGAISNACKDIAMDYHCPVVLLSQLNRDAGNARPNMTQFKESGDIEQDADVVILLHKPEADELPTASHRAAWQRVREHGGRYMELIVDKNRHGKIGIIPAAFYGDRMKMTEV